jgi:protein SCO1/2
MSRSRTSRRTAALVVAGAAGVGILFGLGLHSLSGGGASDRGRSAAAVRGQAVWPEGLRRAPDFSLRDSDGQMFSLASMRGQPVILTFMDSQCHQECPLEGRALAAALRMVPGSQRATVVAVSVNPWEDTPGSARRAIGRFGLAGFRWRWLLGSKAQLERVWDKYGIEVRRAARDIEHTDALYLIDAGGFERAGMVYPFLPTWVSTDLKTLASESH